MSSAWSSSTRSMSPACTAVAHCSIRLRICCLSSLMPRQTRRLLETGRLWLQIFPMCASPRRRTSPRWRPCARSGRPTRRRTPRSRAPGRVARRRGRPPHDLARHARRHAGRHGLDARVPPHAAPGPPRLPLGLREQHVRPRARPQPRHRLRAPHGRHHHRRAAPVRPPRPLAQRTLDPFYRRAGFNVPDDAAGDHRLLVRPGG